MGSGVQAPRGGGGPEGFSRGRARECSRSWLGQLCGGWATKVISPPNRTRGGAVTLQHESHGCNVCFQGRGPDLKTGLILKQLNKLSSLGHGEGRRLGSHPRWSLQGRPHPTDCTGRATDHEAPPADITGSAAPVQPGAGRPHHVGQLPSTPLSPLPPFSLNTWWKALGALALALAVTLKGRTWVPDPGCPPYKE